MAVAQKIKKELEFLQFLKKQERQDFRVDYVYFTLKIDEEAEIYLEHDEYAEISVTKLVSNMSFKGYSASLSVPVSKDKVNIEIQAFLKAGFTLEGIKEALQYLSDAYGVTYVCQVEDEEMEVITPQ